MNYLDEFQIWESKRVRLPEEIDNTIKNLSDRLWNNRFSYNTKRKVSTIQFQTLDGTDGMVKIYIDPDLYDSWATIDTMPLYSRDPMDFVILLCKPAFFSTKTDLYNSLYHEMIHAVDPTQTTKFAVPYQSSYKWWGKDKDYYSHQIEQRAIFSEILNSLEVNFSLHSNKTNAFLLAIIKFFTNPPLRLNKANKEVRLFIKSLGQDRNYKLLNDVYKFDKSGYRVFLKQLYSTYDELKQKFEIK